MDTDFINLTPENLSGEHLCCIIRSKKIHPGIEAKRQWLASRLTEGHVFRKLMPKQKVNRVFACWERKSKKLGFPTSHLRRSLVSRWLIPPIPDTNIQVDTLHKAKELPCVFNNWAVFYNGNFVTVNLFLDVSYIEKIVNRYATT